MTLPLSVEVVIPFSGSDPHRERACAWVLRKLFDAKLKVRLAYGGDPWVKAEAVMPAIEESDADVIVMHDADVWCDGLPEAIYRLSQGYLWSIPHRAVLRLTQASTEAYMKATLPSGRESLERRAYLGMAGGGIVVAKRQTILDIPMDPRFKSWGNEDEAWAMALTCLAGPPWRGNAPLIHLHHPLADRWTMRKGSPANWNLSRRYAAAKNDPERMRALLAEIDEVSLLVKGSDAN